MVSLKSFIIMYVLYSESIIYKSDSFGNEIGSS